MVEFRIGISRKPATAEQLKNFFEKNKELNGYLYIGYPVIKGITIDALWLSREYGILIFDFINERDDFENYSERLDEIYSKVDAKLREYPSLKRKRKELLVNIEIISYAPGFSGKRGNEDLVCNNDQLTDFINKKLLKWNVKEKIYMKVLSIIQSVINLKAKEKRYNVKKIDSKGAKLKELEKELSTLDRNQEKAIIEYFDGVQRIRGLAGSGKTIVLALKAAYLHTQYPEWNIAVTFNTRSLKQQFKDLITKFCYEKNDEEPDWTKIRVINAWGSPKDDEYEKGIYHDFCISNGIQYYDFRNARNEAKKENLNMSPFEYVCEKAIGEVENSVKKYDAILVDEAQDLSESFLKLCYKFLKGPKKRLIYAYDELQKLNERSSLRNPKEFLINRDENFNDQILKVCYRNSRPVLVTAHALGFGIYRKDKEGKNKLVQFFDQPELWKDVGYEIESGELKPGKDVVLYRPEKTSPRYLEDKLGMDKIIIFKKFESKDDQAKWVANEIKKNLEDDELLYKDIIVINPLALTTRKEVALIRNYLYNMDINNHIAGKTNANVFFKNNSITFTGINRAKGNEVPMVYIINADECYAGDFNDRNLIKKRNILFTAITRSKGWVRVVGTGENMKRLIEEFNEVKENNFKLKFRYPTSEEIENLNRISRDISKEEKKELEKYSEVLQDLIRKIENQEIYIEDLPENLREILIKGMKYSEIRKRNS